MFLETGKLLLVFIVGSCATIIGTLVAAKVFPLTSLGADGWKVSHMTMHVRCLLVHHACLQWLLCPQVASALAARHIGGAVNYVAGELLLKCAAKYNMTNCQPGSSWWLTSMLGMRCSGRSNRHEHVRTSCRPCGGQPHLRRSRNG